MATPPSLSVKRRWLEHWPWDTVVAVNAGLCKEKHAQHQPTANGFALARKLWEDARGRELTLRAVLDICRKCHRLAPFCFYNGNTFVAVGRTLIKDLLRTLAPVPAHSLRSVVGHYIAGTIGRGDLEAVLADLKL